MASMIRELKTDELGMQSGDYSATHNLEKLYTGASIEAMERAIRGKTPETRRIGWLLGISLSGSVERDTEDARTATREIVTIEGDGGTMCLPRTRDIRRLDGFVASCSHLERKTTVSEITIAFRDPDDPLAHHGALWVTLGKPARAFFVLTPEYAESNVSLATMIAQAKKAVHERFAACLAPIQELVGV